jgi:hypothetical protein
MLGAVLSLLRADAPRQIMGAPQDWPRWAVLLPHVLAATSHFDIHRQDAGGADAAELLDRAATYLQVHARLAEARPLAERALAIDEATYGPDHPDVATLRANLAVIMRELGRDSGTEQGHVIDGVSSAGQHGTWSEGSADDGT